jgi:hypothetical protein
LSTTHESQLPPVLTAEHMSQLLGMSLRTMAKRRKSRTWPFLGAELPKLDRKPRWSRDVVLATINGTRTRGAR